MRAMILAAGLGTRLWPLTADRAKPAVPFLNRPIITYTVEYLKKFGIYDIIVNLHHQGESIRRVLGDGSAFGVTITYSEEAEILGTGGALDKVRHLLADDTFVVVNGKIITEIDLAAALSTHRERRALATLVLRRNREWDRFSIVEVDGDGRIRRFGGFPAPLTEEGAPSMPAGAVLDDHAPLMFTGIQILEPEIFEFIPRGRFSHTTLEAYPRAIEAGRLIAAHVAEGRWYDLSTLERYLRASLELLQERGMTALLGTGSNVEDGAAVTGSILWERVFVNRSATLRHCIVGDDVVIPPDSHFERVAIVRAALCSAPPERGSIIGDNLVVPF
ncbi:MAG TPA: NDP-sugar synthase [Blastocatellia bacterium]|nr:NDP-sugar synthase [Blastocatellia bacterium]